MLFHKPSVFAERAGSRFSLNSGEVCLIVER